jgi:hypothetical protein
MFHEDSHDDIDEDKLGHQHEDDEENGGNEGTDAAISQTFLRGVAVITQSVLQRQKKYQHRSSQIQTIRKLLVPKISTTYGIFLLLFLKTLSQDSETYLYHLIFHVTCFSIG